MNCQQKLKELYQVYDRVSMISNKNDCQAIRIKHKQLEKYLVLHILPNQNKIYELLCKIRHKALPEIYDYFALDDGCIVLEEYIDGLNVAQIAQTGTFKKSGVVRIAKEVCKALTVLHNHNIVHRDIKPENIMINNSGRVVLIDFNVSRIISNASKDTEALGTIGYAPPEQLGISQSDTRSDIYALGILLNVMLTGKHPSDKIATGKLGRIIKKCTSVNPGDRYQSAQKLMEAL